MPKNQANAVSLVVEAGCTLSIAVALSHQPGVERWFFASLVCFVGSMVASSYLRGHTPGEMEPEPVEGQVSSTLFRMGVIVPLALAILSIVAVNLAGADAKSVGWIMVALAGASGRSLAAVRRSR